MTLGCDRVPRQKALIWASPFGYLFYAPTHNLLQVLKTEKELVPMYQIDDPQTLSDGQSRFLLFELQRFLHNNFSTNLLDHQNNNYDKSHIDNPQAQMDGWS
jgi:hypothetical protein